MSAKDYVEEFFMLQPQKVDDGDASINKEYTGIRGQALTQQALIFIQGIIHHVLDVCMSADAKGHTNVLRGIIQKCCKTLLILSRYQAPPSTPEGYFSGLWLEKMRTACHQVNHSLTVDQMIIVVYLMRIITVC